MCCSLNAVFLTGNRGVTLVAAVNKDEPHGYMCSMAIFSWFASPSVVFHPKSLRAFAIVVSPVCSGGKLTCGFRI